MSVQVVTSLRSVLDVLDRISAGLEGVEHALVLGEEGRVLGALGATSQDVAVLVRSMAGTLGSPTAPVPRGSARCVLSLSHSCVFLYVLGRDLTIALVGPPNWNIALTGRVAEPLLAQFVDAYLAETAVGRAVPATGESAPQTRRERLARRAHRTAPVAPGGSVRQSLAQPDLVKDVDLLERILGGLASL